MNYKHGHNRSVLGKPTPTYKSWAGMKARCNNPNEPNYCYYGGRDIGYQKDWEDFNAFLRDMGERPEGTSLERLDNDGDYGKDNCVWIDAFGQAANRRMPCTNTSGVKGVSWHKRFGRWEAQGMRRGQRFYLYSGPSFEEAVAARKLWENSNE